MFTGIIRVLGAVAAAQTGPGAILRLTVRPGPPGFSPRPALGDSIAVDGCCLTVASPPGPDGVLAFDVIPESLRKTTLGALAPGSRVHLEQAATASTLLDGHIVQGHVDGTAEVIRVDSKDERRLRIRPPAPLMEFLAPKGSVSLAGVSLTVADVNPSEMWFEVALIPTTLEKTLLGDLAPGARVNLECDPMAKTVVHWLRHFGRR